MGWTRKSRRSPSSILRFGPLVLSGMVCLSLAGAAMGYMWLRERNTTLQRQNAALRRQLETVQKETLALEAQLQALTRPEVLFARARILGLVAPEPTQILRVPLRPPTQPSQPNGGVPAAQLATRPGGAARGGGP